MQTFYADIESGFSGYPVGYLIQFERDKSLSRHERLVTVSILAEFQRNISLFVILAVGCFVDYEVQHMFFIIAVAVV